MIKKILFSCVSIVSLTSMLMGASPSTERNERPLSEFFPTHDYTQYDPEHEKGSPYLFEIRIPDQSV